MKNIIKFLFLFGIIISLYEGKVVAKPSITLDGSIVEVKLADEEKLNGITVKFIDDFDMIENNTLGNNIINIIDRLNNGEKFAEVEELNELGIGNYSMLTKIKNLVAYDKEGNDIDKITLTWEVPNLINDLDVRILHYSKVRKLWELIEPISLDYDKKTITAYFEDLSPVAVIYENTSTFTQGNNSAVMKKEEGSNNILVIPVLILVIIIAILIHRERVLKDKIDAISNK